MIFQRIMLASCLLRLRMPAKRIGTTDEPLFAKMKTSVSKQSNNSRLAYYFINGNSFVG
jgi:hypothetical protein